jgi:hypothetical protein
MLTCRLTAGAGSGRFMTAAPLSKGELLRAKSGTGGLSNSSGDGERSRMAGTSSMGPSMGAGGIRKKRWLRDARGEREHADHARHAKHASYEKVPSTTPHRTMAWAQRAHRVQTVTEGQHGRHTHSPKLPTPTVARRTRTDDVVCR